MDFENLLFEQRDHVVLITLNRPESLNALNQPLLKELRDVLDAVNADTSVHCVILTGSGRAFSSGFDLTPPRSSGSQSRGLNTPAMTDIVKLNAETLMRIWNLRQPVVAAVNGYAIAAGCDLALVCDLTLASEQAKFGEPENRHLALSPLMLGPFLGASKHIHEFYYTGDTIDADTAASWNLVNRTIPHAELMDEAWRVAERIALVPAYSTFMTKSSLHRTYDLMGFQQAQQQHRIHDTLVLDSDGIEERDRLMSTLQREGLKAFLDMRDGPFRG